MKVHVRLLVAVALITLAGTFATLVGPKRTQAQSRTPVTVVNTNSQPALTLAVDAHTAFDRNANCSFSSAQSCKSFSIYNIPSGQVAVLESTSGWCTLAPGSHVTLISLSYPGPLSGELFLEGTTYSTASATYYAWTRAIRGFAIPEGFAFSIFLGVSTDTIQPSTSSCVVELAGHLVAQ